MKIEGKPYVAPGYQSNPSPTGRTTERSSSRTAMSYFRPRDSPPPTQNPPGATKTRSLHYPHGRRFRESGLYTCGRAARRTGVAALGGGATDTPSGRSLGLDRESATAMSDAAAGPPLSSIATPRPVYPAPRAGRRRRRGSRELNEWTQTKHKEWAARVVAPGSCSRSSTPREPQVVLDQARGRAVSAAPRGRHQKRRSTRPVEKGALERRSAEWSAAPVARAFERPGQAPPARGSAMRYATRRRTAARLASCRVGLGWPPWCDRDRMARPGDSCSGAEVAAVGGLVHRQQAVRRRGDDTDRGR